MPNTTRTRTRKRPAKQAVESKTVVVKRYKFDNVDSDPEETTEVEVHEFVSDPAYVRASAGMTKSLGPYESLRVDVSITLPCYPAEVDDVYQQVADSVAEKLEKEVDTYLNGESDD